ncbi:acylphosphatase-2 [Drosophila montana]|uniref:acylphosphatase-2 n=1 Tax=Drosophila montana TaxID=40370 RepID=UPI00313CE711
MVFSYKSDLVLKVNTILIVLAISSKVTGYKNSSPIMETIYWCKFEVFGRVQGVFFRKYTEKQANILGVRGWCKNTKEGTVKGELEGPLGPLNEMKHWLQAEGSPHSKIEKVIFSQNMESENYRFNGFSIRD